MATGNLCSAKSQNFSKQILSERLSVIRVMFIYIIYKYIYIYIKINIYKYYHIVWLFIGYYLLLGRCHHSFIISSVTSNGNLIELSAAKVRAKPTISYYYHNPQAHPMSDFNLSKAWTLEVHVHCLFGC